MTLLCAIQERQKMFLKNPVRNNLVLYPIAEMIYNEVYKNPCAIQQGFFFFKRSAQVHTCFLEMQYIVRRNMSCSSWFHLIIYFYFTFTKQLCFRTICLKDYFVVKNTIESDEFNNIFFSI